MHKATLREGDVRAVMGCYDWPSHHPSKLPLDFNASFILRTIGFIESDMAEEGAK